LGNHLGFRLQACHRFGYIYKNAKLKIHFSNAYRDTPPSLMSS
jgi:hypothetical protein